MERVVNKGSWTNAMIQLHRVSQGRFFFTNGPLASYIRAHLTYRNLAQSLALLVEIFYDTLKSDQSLSPPIKTVMWDLYRLFAFENMERESYDCKKYP